MKTTRILPLINLLILSGTIYWNYLSNTGIIDGKNVGLVSNKYDSLFTPASYTFAIWGIIYLCLIIQAVYLVIQGFRGNIEPTIKKLIPYLIVANIANSLWVYVWLKEYTGLSILVMVIILVSLLTAVLKLNMQHKSVPVAYMISIWWPLDIYSGWITVATIANISAYLYSMGWSGGLSEVSWTIIMILIGTAIYIFMIFNRNMREFAAVGIWAFYGIAVRHWYTIPELKFVALSAAAVIFVLTLYHAFHNRKSLPIVGKKKQ
ncbi:tryptophan-rich sensory protein [Marinigracilibium pacificum]|uniref:Tryptophan-rich sensory protein n=1 Tax=Marinigracilibium pacificum TaxID=2729599 RepID=A0A848J017_9BACT|nr:tryptophan-rich sensory protein [Marinigracilibium pacificum]NMM47599.1 tryptophan-rich sensory protein [Marinigracilibium pacificum]